MESFLVAVNAVIPFFCYLALGYTMKIRGVVKEEFLQKLNQMVFRVFYPFMTFYNIYKADAESLPNSTSSPHAWNAEAVALTISQSFDWLPAGRFPICFTSTVIRPL